MGSSQSQPKVREVVKTVYTESDESKQMRIIGQLEKQLEELKKEVVNVKPAINADVKKTIESVQEATLLRYSQLKDRNEILKNVQEIFGGFPALDFLVETATSLVAAMNNTKELTEILRWHERKVVKRIGDKVIGLEVHYKVRIQEEDKGNIVTGRTKDTVVLIAYKVLAHTMDLKAKDFLDDEDRKMLKF